MDSKLLFLVSVSMVLLNLLVPTADAWHDEHLASMVPTYSRAQTVTVDGPGKMTWPCCSVTQTQAFFSVCNSGFPGQYELLFVRDARAEDRWDTVFTVHELQSVVLRGSEALLAVPPLWGKGFHVKNGGMLELSFLRTGGSLEVASGAIGLTLAQVTVPHPLTLRGGNVVITDSLVTAGGQIIELSPVSLVISGSQLLGQPRYMNATHTFEALSITSSTVRNWAMWRSGFVNTSFTRVVQQRALSLVRVTAVDGVTLGNVYTDDGDISCRLGWKGEECLQDTDECATDNGLCAQHCINSIGSYSCGCDLGYNNVGFFLCIDIDECYTEVDGCSHECRNYDGTYVCDCPDGLLLGEDLHTCEDVNECEAVTICDAYANSFCANRFGTYDCVCDSGYIGAPLNGTACAQAPESSEGQESG